MSATLRAIARVATVIPIAVGALVLYGWWQDVDVLKRIVPREKRIAAGAVARPATT